MRSGDVSGNDGGTKPCKESPECRKGPERRGILASFCRDCRFALENGGTHNHWYPATKGLKHPALEAEKRDARRSRIVEKQTARASKDRRRQRVGRNAARAEAGTTDLLVQATRNSGRTNRDGDHQLGSARLDSKHQSGRLYPVVDLIELDKIRRQAAPGLGGLVLVNANGRRVVVFDLEEYVRAHARDLAAAE